MNIKFIGAKPLIESQFETATIEECLQFCKDIKIIGVDTETIGDCWSGHIFCIQLGNRDVQYVIDCTLVDVRIFKEVLEDENKLFLFQNAKYDLKFLYAKGIKIKNLYDTFLAECILTNGKDPRELGLKALALKYCNRVLNKEIRGKINYLGLTDEVIEYAAMDVIDLEDIMNKQIEQIKYWNLEAVVQLENDVTKVFAEMEYYGMKLDVNQWLIQAERREKEAHKFEDILNQYILNNPTKFNKFIDNQLDLFNTELKTNINWSSPKQVLEILTKEGLKVDSVNEKIIEKYKIKFSLVDLYLKFKENQTSISKFGKDFLKWVNKSTGRVTTSYWQILLSGRVSSGKKNEFPNIQQLPATNEIRNCFIASDGYSFVDCDYSAMELVIAGVVSQEDSWIEAFNKGYDLHSVVAESVYKNKWENSAETVCQYYINKQKCSCKKHKELRDKIKTLNYLSIYGGGPQKLSNSINITIEEAKEVINNYFKGLPKLTKFLKTLKEYGKKNKFIRTKSPYGRIRFFEDPKDDFKKIGEIERQSGNTFIQGTGADIAKLAMVKLWKIREERNLDVKFVLQLHDAILSEVKDELVQEWKDIQINCMKEAFEEVIGFPIDVDGYISKFWKK